MFFHGAYIYFEKTSPANKKIGILSGLKKKKRKIILDT